MPETAICLPQPCHESWASMTPTGVGRHCAACRDTVVDFTSMTDAEVVAFMRRYPRISCGRFRESQLERVLVAPAYTVVGWRRWLGATVAVLGLGALTGPKVQAQSSAPMYWGGPQPAVPAASAGIEERKAPTEAPPATGAGTLEVSPDSLHISGVVRNRIGMRQEGARVSLRRGGRGTAVTDARGYFKMVVARKDLTADSRLHAVAWPEKAAGFYLLAKVAIDPLKTRPYAIHLKKEERIISGKFR